MKKIFLILLIALAVMLVWFVSQKPKTSSATADKPAVSKETTTESSPEQKISPSIEKQPMVAKTPSAPRPAFLDSKVMADLRAALANGDRAGLEQAYNALTEYFREHPEQIDDYLAVFRSEKDEYVLRYFAIAMADSEAGLLENDRIIQAAIELAKDPSFEQRQHIMLNLMSKLPEMRDDAYQAIVGLSQSDPNSQVKTSAVAVFADWMDRLPEKKEMLLGQISEIFKTAKDDDVRGFTYQVLALHREDLSQEMQLAVSERFKAEEDPFNANLLAAALSAAPDEIRKEALSRVQSAFAAETDLEKRRNLLVQIVCLAKGESAPLLQKNSSGDSLLAQDARDYLNLLASNSAVDPDVVLQQKAIRDASQQEINHKD